MEPGEAMKIKVEQSIEMWVRLPQLPVELWNEYTFQGIAKALRGRFLEKDPCTRKWEKLGFARVKMEVPLSFHPVPKITLRDGKGLAVPQAIVYESKINYCSSCGAHTHLEASYKFKRLDSEGLDQCKNPWDDVQALQHPRDRRRENASVSAFR
ncbi:hypothetical protein EJ110_NYTH48094 [Nymphaea thermarum]|nr:hypothetical protein EJ110_NYTH48094 [Nymphaea thermarum]